MTENQKSGRKKRAKSSNARPTIGLVSTHLGDKISYSMWQGIIDKARERDVNLISFMAHDLDTPLGFEAQANVLYDLVNPARLDGLIIWTAPVINQGGPASIKRVFDQYRALPIVAIEEGGPEDIPRVLGDDYGAMRSAIVHLIEAHGCQRIAFIRGPDATHKGAHERYQAYQDVLAEYGLPFDPDLVSPPTAGVWPPEAGEAAISLFLEQRRANFEAVVAVNDVMAIAAMHALQTRGIHVPQQVAVVGFDDVDDSNCVIPPLTTVSIQTYDKGRQAVEMLLTLLEGGEVPDKVIIPLEKLIIRQSCGCVPTAVVQAAAGPIIVTPEPFEKAVAAQRNKMLAEMKQAAETATAELLPDWADPLLTAFLTELKGEASGGFLLVLAAILHQVIIRGDQVVAWPNVISALRRCIRPYLSSDSPALQRAEDLWLQAQVMIGETAQQAQRYQAAQAEQQSRVLDEIGSALITTFDVEGLTNILTQELPRLGIPSCYLSLYEKPQRPTDRSRLILAYDERGRLEPERGRQVFPSPDLTPEGLLPQGRSYSMVVEALYFREDQLGFVLFEEGPRKGMIYETLRERISSALKGALLREQEERWARQLQTVAEVGTVVSTILDMSELLQSVVDLTKANFRLYHAHIYLLNETGDTLVLAAGAGEVGQQMVNQGWSIPLEQERSLVARAARTRQGVSINNVHQEPDFLPNPLLPETRAELAVPLIAGEQVLGVLDVQADVVDRFTEEDMRLKTILAGQIAAALQNARSFAEQQRATLLLSERVKELNCLNEIGREIVETPPIPELLQWVTERIPPAMRYPQLCRAAIEYDGQIYGVPEAIALPCQIVHALRIGAEVTGRVYIAYTEKHDFLDEESALIGGIAGRVGSYIESRRLLEQIQQRAIELEEVTNFLDTIINNIPTGIFIKDAKELKYLRINRAHANLSGLNQVEVIGTSVYDYFPKEQADFFTAKDRETLAKGELVDIPEVSMQTINEGPRWVHTQKVPIYGLDGQPKYLLGMSQDITERKRAEEVLRENEALYQSLIDALPQNVYRIDRKGRVTYGNKAYLANLGMTLDECRGKTVHDFFPKELADKYEADDEEVMQRGEIIEIVESYKSPIANEMSYVQTVKVPIRDFSGQVIGIQGIYWDITKSKRSELALTKRAVELETVARVGTAASTILEIDKLLQEVVDLTKSSFGLYHAHIYLFNETGDTLVLAASTGEVGRQMVAQGWSIPLEQERSLVVQAARTRQGVSINDVHQEPDFLPNPLLPETRAELAVPLIAGEQVLGVLDVQADVVDRFTEEDMRLKTILAGQIAAALQNARSFAEQQRATLLLGERVKELNCLNEIGREIVETPPIPELLQWVTERIPPAMRYPQLCRAAIEYDGQIYGVPEAIALPCQIVHALRIGAEVTGRVYIAYTEKHDFLDEESALIGGIAGRVGSYIESRRLLEQIQQRAVEFEEASSFLDSVIENIPILITVKDAQDLRFIRWNKYGEKLVGVDRKDMVGKTDHDFFPKEEADFFTAKDREVLTSGKWLDIPEEPIQNAAGEIRLLHTQKVPIYGPDGKPKYLLAMAEDITERKQSERIIVQQKEFFSKVINSMPVGVFAKDVQNDYRFSLWNTKMEELFGVKREDMLGKTDYDYSEKEAADDYRKVDIAAIEAGQLIDIPVEEITTSQGVRLAHTTKLPIYDSEGKPEVLLVVLEDITERRQAEETLRENEARLSEALTVARLGNWEFDVATQMFTFNDQFYSLLHTTAEQEGGYVMPAARYAQKYVHPEDASMIAREIQALAETDDPNYSSQLEYRIIRADGEAGYLAVQFRRDQRGQTVWAVGIVQDITERKRADLEREKLLAEVEAAYRQYIRQEWGQFLGEQHQGNWHIEHQPDVQGSTFNVQHLTSAEKLAEVQDEVIREGKTKVIVGASGNGHEVEPSIVAPIALRGQVIGTLSLQDVDPERQWTNEEMALVETVSEQLALTLENLRLIEESQRNGWRDQVISESTAKVWLSSEIEEVMKAAVAQLGDKLRASEVVIRLGTEKELVQE